MIQRIQTVFLAVGAVLVAVAPFAGELWRVPATEVPWFVPAVGVALAAAFAASAIAIFLFRMRERQRTFVVVAQLLTLAALVALFFGRRATATLPGAEGATTEDWLLFVMPAVAYVLFLLARRAIDRDIRLLKSVDRLR